MSRWTPWRRTRDEIVCRQFVEAVTDYLEGAMARTEREQVERHLAACPHCTRYLRQIETTIRLTGQLTVEDVDGFDPVMRGELLDAFRAAFPPR